MFLIQTKQLQATDEKKQTVGQYKYCFLIITIHNSL